MASLEKHGKQFRIIWREHGTKMHQAFASQAEAEAFRTEITRRTSRQTITTKIQDAREPLTTIATRYIANLHVSPNTQLTSPAPSSTPSSPISPTTPSPA